VIEVYKKIVIIILKSSYRFAQMGFSNTYFNYYNKFQQIKDSHVKDSHAQNWLIWHGMTQHTPK